MLNEIMELADHAAREETVKKLLCDYLIDKGIKNGSICLPTGVIGHKDHEEIEYEIQIKISSSIIGDGKMCVTNNDEEKIICSKPIVNELNRIENGEDE